MKRIGLALVASATLACSGPVVDSVRPSTLTISIVGTNDLHGAVLARNGRGGLPLLGGYLSALRAARSADGGAVLLIDAGDLFQGTLESNLNEGAAVVSAYNALGYSASAVGNHEFDFGPTGPAAVPEQAVDDPRGALKARAAQARFPFLAANIIDTETQQPVAWPNVHPSTIVNVAGIPVGIVGVATRNTLTATMALNTGGLAIAPLVPAIEAEAKRVRAAGAMIVIVAAHAGGECRAFTDPDDLSSCAPDEEIFEVAKALPPGFVDVIVAGHRHNGIAHVVAGIAVMSSYSRGRAFGRVDLTVARDTGLIVGRRQFPPHDVCAAVHADGSCADPADAASAPATYEGQPVIASRAVEELLAPAVAAADAVRNAPLGSVVRDLLRRADTVESALGNLVADWTRLTADRADVGIVNGGGLRADLPAGAITYGRLYEVMPFDNAEAMIVMSGAELRKVIAENLKRKGSIMLLSGVRAAARCDGEQLRVEVRRDSGATVRDHDRLRVATMDFLVTGGDQFFTPIEPLTGVGSSESAPVLREEISTWLKSAHGSWRSADLLNERNRRLVYPGTRPVQCPAMERPRW